MNVFIKKYRIRFFLWMFRTWAFPFCMGALFMGLWNLHETVTFVQSLDFNSLCSAK